MNSLLPASGTASAVAESEPTKTSSALSGHSDGAPLDVFKQVLTNRTRSVAETEKSETSVDGDLAGVDLNNGAAAPSNSGELGPLLSFEAAAGVEPRPLESWPSDPLSSVSGGDYAHSELVPVAPLPPTDWTAGESAVHLLTAGMDVSPKSELSGPHLTNKQLGVSLAGGKLAGQLPEPARRMGSASGTSSQGPSLTEGIGAALERQASATRGSLESADMDDSASSGAQVKHESPAARWLGVVGKGGSARGDVLALSNLRWPTQVQSDDIASKFHQGDLQEIKTVLLTAAAGQLVSGQISYRGEALQQLPVDITFGQAGWADRVAERTALLAAQNVKVAELQLDPPELGPLQVKISVNQDQQAHVSFVATNGQVREVLDQTLTRLRELFTGQGLELAGASVSEHSFHDSGQGREQEEASRTAVEGAQDSEASGEAQPMLLASYGVDYYV